MKLGIRRENETRPKRIYISRGDETRFSLQMPVIEEANYRLSIYTPSPLNLLRNEACRFITKNPFLQDKSIQEALGEAQSGSLICSVVGEEYILIQKRNPKIILDTSEFDPDIIWRFYRSVGLPEKSVEDEREIINELTNLILGINLP